MMQCVHIPDIDFIARIDSLSVRAKGLLLRKLVRTYIRTTSFHYTLMRVQSLHRNANLVV